MKKQNKIDVVECVNAGDNLTVGKRYMNLSTGQDIDHIVIRDDSGDKSIISMDHFKTVEEIEV